MNFRAPPTATVLRARQTDTLIADHATDLARWAELDSLATQWDTRAVMAAEWIPAGSGVLDIGCGAMALESALKPGCTYTPADVVERRPGAWVVDLNKQEFPVGNHDWVTFLGVLEYIHQIDWPLLQAHKVASHLLLTYCTYIGGDPVHRRGMGWVNDLAQLEFEALLNRTGWRIIRQQEVKRGPTNIQIMYACQRQP